MSAKVAIIGRPNVGKSTLFNRLVGRKLALVDDQPGVTRDRREGEARLGDLAFTIVDTAGLEEGDPETLAGRMRAQTEAALADCDAILFVVDARAGVTPADRHFAQAVRRADKPIILIANKAEGAAGEAASTRPLRSASASRSPFSAEHGEGLGDLYDALVEVLPARRAARPRRGDEAAPLDPRRRGGRQRARSDQAAAHRRARAAERRQVDAAQPHPRRGSPADRPRARPHPRQHRPRGRVARAQAQAVRHRRPAPQLARRREAREARRRRRAAGGALRRSRGAAARRDDPVREAGPDARRSRRARGQGAGHRPQQMGPRSRTRATRRANCAPRPTGCCRNCAACA